LYHNLGLVITSAARPFGVPASQYIDDRHVGQLLIPHNLSPSPQHANAAAYILCYLLIEAGYYLGLAKCQPVPSTCVRYLVFLSDSVTQAFLIPQDKKEKFARLRENILASKFADLNSLQRFAGKAISFSLAIPGCKLYVRQVFASISHLAKNSKTSFPVEGALRDEICYWQFLVSWTDTLCWRSEHHHAVTVFCDASKRAWGGVLIRDGSPQEVRDYPGVPHQCARSFSPVTGFRYLQGQPQKHESGRSYRQSDIASRLEK
jgi:hypothetical protein